MEFNTALLHQQFDSDTQNGATIPPIYQVSAFAQSSAEQLEKVFNNKAFCRECDYGSGCTAAQRKDKSGLYRIDWEPEAGCCGFKESIRFGS